MRINIYYGGRGLIGDPTMFVVKKMMQVLEELNVRVEKYDLYDQKSNISRLPQTLKEADGVILASTVEWHGVGGYIMNFLDACWLFGDKEKIRQTYMAPVVMSTTYGEKEGQLDLINAWEALGGITCNGICGYIPDVAELERSEQYQTIIEKCAENIYRSINQKISSLPASGMAVKQKVYKTMDNFFSQQETEQLSEYVSDDQYVNRQKKDIQELADIFKGKLGNTPKNNQRNYKELFERVFLPQPETHLKYKINLRGKAAPFVIIIDNAKLVIQETEISGQDIELTMDVDTFNEIVDGRKTFQGGFMEGSIVSKGDFKSLRTLDSLFPFMK